jgi:hypothetical protein
MEYKMRSVLGIVSLMFLLYSCAPISPKAISFVAPFLPTPPPTLEPCVTRTFSARISASSQRVPVGSTVSLHVKHEWSGNNLYYVSAQDEDDVKAQVLFSGYIEMAKNPNYQSKNFEFVSGGGYVQLDAVLRAIRPGKTIFYATVNGEFSNEFRDVDMSCHWSFNYENATTQQIMIEAVKP